MKSKREIINEIAEEMRISKQDATKVFEIAMRNGDIRRIFDWKRIVDLSIVALVFIAGAYALIRTIVKF